MTKPVYQLKITLKGSSPEIWRRVIVDPDVLLVDFHRILQTTMGWTNSHIHLFHDGKHEYSPREFEVEDTIDSRSVKLNEILSDENKRILYEYDFGDGWIHEILLEKIIKDKDKGQIPRCIDGERNCPPEDCGGMGGYEALLEIISDPDPDHEEYKEIMQWLGGSYDPDYFNKEEVNEQLSQKDYGCLWL
ncbi:MAG: plasmid pRiA4b ORF-3 family protein [Bacteroidales bacterium]